MSDLFILRNQDGLFLDRHGEWVDGGEASSLFRTPHKDEALNQKLELTVRHPELRIRVVECQLDAKGRPQLEAEHADPASQPLLTEQETTDEPA